jgi:hypothetical protein
MFQPTFDTTTEEHMGWDQMEFKDVLVTIDAPQQAEEVGPSKLTHALVWTQPMLTVYFGAPSMFITLWFGFDYGTNPPLGTLII